jgi:hypothetical protein
MGRALELRVLRLDSNNLVELPGELCECITLEQLHIGFNAITVPYASPGGSAGGAQKRRTQALPRDIGKLCNLRTLGARSNALTRCAARVRVRHTTHDICSLAAQPAVVTWDHIDARGSVAGR